MSAFAADPMLKSAEWVLPGHPDKLADAIADAIVQAAWRRDPRALVAVEVALFRSSVFLTGRIAGRGTTRLDVASIARSVLANAGYSEESRPALSAFDIRTDLCRGPFEPGEAEVRAVADDQAIVTGYACSTPGCRSLPVEHALARHIAKALHECALARPARFGQDGKVIVFVHESPGERRWRLASLNASIEQRTDATRLGALDDVRAMLSRAVDAFARCVPGFVRDEHATIDLNTDGWSGAGGVMSDNGLSGKKLVVDYYGPHIPIGGGAMSGKDFWKVDRAGPLIARELAVKAIELHGCREALVTLGICPGDRAFRIVRVQADNRMELDPRRLGVGVDLNLASRAVWLQHRDLVEVARWGHWWSEPSVPSVRAKTQAKSAVGA